MNTPVYIILYVKLKKIGGKIVEQIFIEVHEGSTVYNIDIRDSVAEERFEWYRKLTKEMIIQLLEKIGKFDNKNSRNK